MVITNKAKEVCKRLWTRVQSQEKSILDYVLTYGKFLSRLSEMTAYENKQHSTIKLEKSRKKKILRPQCNTTKTKLHNNNIETKEEQNNYQMWIRKI